MGTVSKALDLLDLFTRTRPQIGLSDLARLADLNKATCFRLLTELAAYGLIEQVGPSREYRLGPAALRLAGLREAHVPMRDAAMPVLQALARDTGETAHMSLLMGEILRPLAVAYSNVHATRVTMEDTNDLPFHATSSGLAFLSFQPDTFADTVLERPFTALTSLTETNPDRLRVRLRAVRKTGIAESAGSYEIEVNSLAVPLFDAFGRCSGAVAVAGPEQRMTEAQCARIKPALMRAGTEITNIWGGTLPPEIAKLWRQTV
jgi:DNA-binding IclR family transcriptional regulator